MPPKTPREWNQRYLDGTTPWNSDLVARELRQTLQDRGIEPTTAAEVGCGLGTNAIFLAQQGFSVTAYDCAEEAIKIARQRAVNAGVEVNFVEADLLDPSLKFEPVDFLFDRACYHCVRKIDFPAYLTTLKRLSHEGTKLLLLAGNPAEPGEGGPPRVSAAELCTELEPLFQILELKEVRFQDAGGVEGPIGWSCWMQRRE